MAWWIYLIVFLLIISVFRLYNILSCRMCSYDIQIYGKTAIVTGGNSGIGFETAKDLADRGARVILACRNESRGTEARNKIIQATGNNNIILKILDLACLESVRRFAEDIINTEEHIHILINNAGAYASGNYKTKDGIIIDMQVNHFAPFLLTNLLLPVLKASTPSRIVNVSSSYHWIGTVDFEKINEECYYNSLRVYCNSKLCNILFSNELARRLENTGVISNSLHPGATYTNVLQHSPTWVQILSYVLVFFVQTAREGARTCVYLAVSPDCAGITGKYYVDCGEAWSSSATKNQQLAETLWEYSSRLVNQQH